MNTLKEAVGDFLPPTPIRVVAGLSRYPIHRLAKHGEIAIDIREKNEHGELFVKWEVNCPKKPGHPGPLAYKIDTLIINRRIEESPRPIPRYIRLGSLKEIAALLELGGDTNIVKNALRQNAFAGITAKIRYRTNDGRERVFEGDFNRYAVVITGEELPDGRRADAVYIVLSDPYMHIINAAVTRPLDYDYLRSLPPAPQRFYELLSYQIYSAIKNERPRAKLLYSEFCTYAPMTRYFDWEKARKQMAKIDRPHRQSGYVLKVDYEQTADRDGKPDWIMLYQPGPKARAEYRAFTKRGGPVMLEAEPSKPSPLPQLAAPEPSPLEAELIASGVSAHIAADLVRDYDEPRIRLQIEILKYRLAGKKAAKIDDTAAWLVSAIKQPHQPPKGFTTEADRQRQAEAKRENERQAAEARRAEKIKDDAERRERDLIAAHWKGLSQAEQESMMTDAMAAASPDMVAMMRQRGPMRKIGEGIIRDQHIRKLLQERGELALAEA